MEFHPFWLSFSGKELLSQFLLGRNQICLEQEYTTDHWVLILLFAKAELSKGMGVVLFPSSSPRNLSNNFFSPWYSAPVTLFPMKTWEIILTNKDIIRTWSADRSDDHQLEALTPQTGIRAPHNRFKQMEGEEKPAHTHKHTSQWTLFSYSILQQMLFPG